MQPSGQDNNGWDTRVLDGCIIYLAGQSLKLLYLNEKFTSSELFYVSQLKD